MCLPFSRLKGEISSCESFLSYALLCCSISYDSQLVFVKSVLTSQFSHILISSFLAYSTRRPFFRSDGIHSWILTLFSKSSKYMYPIISFTSAFSASDSTSGCLSILKGFDSNIRFIPNGCGGGAVR